MTQLTQSLRLDLAYALTRDIKLLADLFERVVRIHIDAEAHTQDFRLARRQAGQDVMRRFLESLRRC